MYIAAISVMLTCAIGSAPNSPVPALQVGGAALFYMSDIAVARQQFVRRTFLNKAIGLPLYYVAQLLIAGLLYF